jgi:hypothetical protein
MNKQFFISLLFGLITFVILGGVFGSLVFLPEMAGWYEVYPEAVRETPDFVSGLVVGLLQLIALIILLPKLQITTVSGGAIFGAIYSVVLWLNGRPSNGLCNQYRIVRLRSKRCIIVRSNGRGLRISHYLVAKKVRLVNKSPLKNNYARYNCIGRFTLTLFKANLVTKSNATV